MAYRLEMIDADIHIDASAFPDVIRIIKTLGPAHTRVNRALLESASSLEDVLKAWRWSSRYNEKSDLVGLDFFGDKGDLVDEELLFDEIAPFVRAGSWIKMRNDGYDGGNVEVWRLDMARTGYYPIVSLVLTAIRKNNRGISGV